ncbi:Synaptotagmin-16 [Manis javanica]|nr:Synaptotagmin-16 [Manis javanica]
MSNFNFKMYPDILETHSSCLLPVDSFGGDEKLCTCGSDEEVVKQFEISVPWSQSFRSGASEKEKQTGLEQKSKFHHLQSTHEGDGTEVSACEGILCIKPFLSLDQGRPMPVYLSHSLILAGDQKTKAFWMWKASQGLDGANQLNYSETLSYAEDNSISTHLQSPCEWRDLWWELRVTLPRQEEQDWANFQVPSGVLKPISKCGDLDVIFEYRAASQKLTVTIVRAQGLPDKD